MDDPLPWAETVRERERRARRIALGYMLLKVLKTTTGLEEEGAKVGCRELERKRNDPGSR